jgi:hypothetical protein
MKGVTIIETTPFKLAYWQTREFRLNNDDPAVFVGILSDNQRSPIFIIGLRIPSAADGQGVK